MVIPLLIGGKLRPNGNVRLSVKLTATNKLVSRDPFGGTCGFDTRHGTLTNSGE
jgi:hypothetical protein